jgi:hypothetical protein
LIDATSKYFVNLDSNTLACLWGATKAGQFPWETTMNKTRDQIVQLTQKVRAAG